MSSATKPGSLDKDSLRDDVERSRKEFDEARTAARDAKSVLELRNRYLSRKKGVVTLYLEKLGGLPPEEKREAGRLLNAFKKHVEESLAALEKEARDAGRSGTGIPDLTLPGREDYQGAPHPVVLVQRQIEQIFAGMGFAIEQGPEIETDYYNFEALNFPPYHPARDDWDTLYINDKLLLRTHTSPVQIRVMERQKPPIRMINPGRVFRKETSDATHLPMFYQVEGLVVDEGITFAHLKGTLEYFLRKLLGEKLKIRFRPSFFPFTEPSAEVDVECVICRGKDPACRTCGGSGWKEILGSGMVHPQVFKNVNIDPEKYTGWAFGMGIERLALFAYNIPDMRYFYENDLRFTRQFHRK
jgi:phenylalanyl-tRNA synthetase alpha chain